jgi:hypothetical protein
VDVSTSLECEGLDFTGAARRADGVAGRVERERERSWRGARQWAVAGWWTAGAEREGGGGEGESGGRAV